MITGSMRNSVDYDEHLSVLSDCHSPVAVSAANTDLLGVTNLYLKGLHMQSCEPLFRPLLRVLIRNDHGWEPVRVVERTTFPGVWQEIGETANVRIEQSIWFGANDRLFARWRVSHIEPNKNQHNSLAPIRLALFGQVADDLWKTNASVDSQKNPEHKSDSRDMVMSWCLRLSTTNILFRRPYDLVMRMRLMTTGEIVRAGFIDEVVTVFKLDDKSALATDTQQTGAIHWCEPRLVNNEVTALFSWSFGDSYPSQNISSANTLQAVREKWSQWLQSIPISTEMSHYDQHKLVQCVNDIVTSTVRAPGYGNFDQKMAVLASPINWSSTNFFWDSMIALPTLGLINPDWAAEVVECYVQHAGPRSLPPPFLNAFPLIAPDHRSMECYAPIGSWAVCKLWQCGNKNLPLSRIYQSLCRLHESWFAVGDHDGDGVPEWRNSGCPADDSPLYDRYKPYSSETKHVTCFNLMPHLSVHLCSYLLMDMHCLKKMAHALGNEKDVEHWRMRAQWLGQLIVDRLWNEEDYIFYDRDSTTNEQTRVKTFFGLLPLWAGAPLQESKARAAIERHLLNPEEFWGAVPFPSVAYNEPTYDALGYWRGRMWPHVYFWNTEILVKFGYSSEADKALRRFLAIVMSGRQVAENYPSQRSKLCAAGMPHYSFGTGTLVHFLLNWHLHPL